MISTYLAHDGPDVEHLTKSDDQLPIILAISAVFFLMVAMAIYFLRISDAKTSHTPNDKKETL